MPKSHPVYLDYQATTPCDPRVVEEMLPYFTDAFGNPSSIDHRMGNQARQSVETQRERVLRLLGDTKGRLIFTSGATEANNLAIIGYARANSAKGKHIVSCVTEHKAVLDPLTHLVQHDGFDVTLIPVDQSGLPDLDKLKESLRPDTVMVSFMAVNNEIGTVTPLKAIADLVHQHSSAVLHCDATQALGKIPFDVGNLGIDMASFSGHKMYGPKGIGALYIRRGIPLSRLMPVIFGGGHERGLRSGTLNVPGIVGLSKAYELAEKDRERETQRIRELRDTFLSILESELDGWELNGHTTNRVPHNVNVYFKGVSSKSLLHLLRNDVYISAGSACTSEDVQPSHVIQSLGFTPERAYSSVRLSFGRYTSEEDTQTAAKLIAATVRRIRKVTGTS
jgi:cysteine desulfurase